MAFPDNDVPTAVHNALIAANDATTDVTVRTVGDTSDVTNKCKSLVKSFTEVASLVK